MPAGARRARAEDGRIGELSVRELTEVVQDAWLARASPARAAAWLNASSAR